MSPTPVIPMAPKDTTTFYLHPLVASMCIGAVAAWQTSDKEKLSGKQSRKLGRIRRALIAAVTESNEQRQDLISAYRDRYPEGHERAGQFKEVFVKDADGNDTEQVDPTQMALDMTRL